MNQFLMSEDAKRFVNEAVIAPAEYINTYMITTSPTSVSIPLGARIAIFSSNVNFFVSWNGSPAAVPAINITNGSGPEMNPVARDVSNYTSFSVVGASSGILTVSYFV